MAQNPADRRPTLTSLDALSPCVIKLCVADISTVLEPSSTTSTTARYAGLLDHTTRGALGHVTLSTFDVGIASEVVVAPDRTSVVRG